MRTHFSPCPGLSRSRDTSRYTPSTGEGPEQASPITVAAPPAPASGPARDLPPLRRSQLAASPRRGVLHGARLLAAASPRGPGLRVGGCHWSGGAGAARPVCVPCVPRWGRGRAGATRAREATREVERGGRVRRAGTAAKIPMFHRSTCRCNAHDVGRSYKLKFLLKGVRDDSSEFSKFRGAFILSQHKPTMK